MTHLNGEKTALRKASIGIDMFKWFHLFASINVHLRFLYCIFLGPVAQAFSLRWAGRDARGTARQAGMPTPHYSVEEIGYGSFSKGSISSVNDLFDGSKPLPGQCVY
jgi:hypothetical protein